MSKYLTAKYAEYKDGNKQKDGAEKEMKQISGGFWEEVTSDLS